MVVRPKTFHLTLVSLQEKTKQKQIAMNIGYAIRRAVNFNDTYNEHMTIDDSVI